LYDRLVNGHDDVRADILEHVAGTAHGYDYSELRQRILAGVGPEGVQGEARGWLAMTLSVIAWDDGEAMRALGHLSHPGTEPDRWVRFWTLAGLYRARSPGLLEIAEKLFHEERDPLPRVLSQAILAQARGGDALQAFLGLMRQTDRNAVWCALRALREVPMREAIDPMCDLLLAEHTEEVGYDALRAMAHPTLAKDSAERIADVLGRDRALAELSRAAEGSPTRARRDFQRLRDYMTGAPDDAAAQPTPGYASDTIPGRGLLGDELGIGQEVRTLCSVLLHNKVEPPLAVGLFGDWGTGKTYFMESMWQEVESLAGDAAKALREERPVSYHTEVVQIRFNAWHYIDANLWASLVTHIFEELAKAIDPKSPGEARKRLAQELETAKELSAEAQRQNEQVKALRDSRQEELTKLETTRKQCVDKLASLSLSDLAWVFQQNPGLRDSVNKHMQDLGVPAVLDNLESLERSWRQAQGTSARLRVGVGSFFKPEGRNPRIVLLVLLVLGVPALGWLLNRPWLEGQDILTRLTTQVAAGLTLAAGLCQRILKFASGPVAQFENALQQVSSHVEARREVRTSAEVRLHQEIVELNTKETTAVRRLGEAEAKVAEIQNKISEIEAGQSLSRLILDRVASDDYRKHLGIISTIRKDFEQLSTLLGKDGAVVKGSAKERVDRIILYIDDLDRCPASKVIEVLQAVHLLLAFPLFVVVVGVDSRWLLHSLEHEYSAFSARREKWLTTPQNYLEKIFQIPFTLRPMDATGYQRLVSGLLPVTRTAETSPAPAPVSEAGTPEAAPATPAQAAGLGASAPVVSPVPLSPPQERDLNPASLEIRDWEQRFAHSLYNLIPTPRAAKRFTNVYRLLKAPLRGPELRAFEGSPEKPGEFQPVMLLLALMIGHPRRAGILFSALLHEDNRNRGWREIVRAFLKSEAAGEDLQEALAGILDRIVVADSLAPLLGWTPQVARYSFEASKSIASYRGPAPAVMIRQAAV